MLNIVKILGHEIPYENSDLGIYRNKTWCHLQFKILKQYSTLGEFANFIGYTLNKTEKQLKTEKNLKRLQSLQDTRRFALRVKDVLNLSEFKTPQEAYPSRNF